MKGKGGGGEGRGGKGQMWWCLSVILAFRKLKAEESSV
jgi:hypothetical protein